MWSWGDEATSETGFGEKSGAKSSARKTEPAQRETVAATRHACANSAYARHFQTKRCS